MQGEAIKRQAADQFTYKRAYLEGPVYIPTDEVEDLLAQLVVHVYLAEHPGLRKQCCEVNDGDGSGGAGGSEVEEGP